MCGIAGAYGENHKVAQSVLAYVRHRGPDGEAVIHLDKGFLGHTRLAIVDVQGGNQPLADVSASRWLVCNGEIYNHPGLRRQYSDYAFQTESDSEDILAVYARHGGETPHQLEGMYAFAIASEDELVLARDPLGIKPLYYGEDDTGFYFASEIKALQDIVPNVKEFPPGYWYSTKQGFAQYYDIETVVQELSSTTSSLIAPADVRKRIQTSVHTHLMADVPLGVFLSGGLDSSIIAAIVAQEMSKIHSFSVGMKGSPDLANAREVARYLDTHHHEYIYTTQEMVEILPTVIYYLESFDPALVRSAVANYFLARLASRYVKVILSGEGADELYSGYRYLKRFETRERLEQELLQITAELHNRNLQRLDRMTMAHGVEGRVPFLDRQFVEFSFQVPIEQKLSGPHAIEKWILRKAFEDMLPESVVWRTKQKFAEGAGSAHIFAQIAASEISDEGFRQEQIHVFEMTGHFINSKEELYYYRIFRRFFNAEAVPLVGFSRSL
jgi:asparagine synthase (glutamine-hydrolysing)